VDSAVDVVCGFTLGSTVFSPVPLIADRQIVVCVG
jgi:hypothetical protein